MTTGQNAGQGLWANTAAFGRPGGWRGGALHIYLPLDGKHTDPLCRLTVFCRVKLKYNITPSDTSPAGPPSTYVGFYPTVSQKVSRQPP